MGELLKEAEALKYNFSMNGILDVVIKLAKAIEGPDKPEPKSELKPEKVTKKKKKKK